MSSEKPTTTASHPPHWNPRLSTFFELAAEVDGTRYLIGYVRGKSRSKAMRCIHRSERVRLGLVQVIGRAQLEVDGDKNAKLPTVFSGQGYRVFYTGRTELEAWQGGRLPWVADFAPEATGKGC